MPRGRELGLEWRCDETYEKEYTMGTITQEISDGNPVINHAEIHWGEIWAEVKGQ